MRLTLLLSGETTWIPKAPFIRIRYTRVGPVRESLLVRSESFRPPI